MKGIFGASKPKQPPPTLSDTVSVLETRGDSYDVKIRKCDQELQMYKDKMKGMKPGPALNGYKQKALRVLKQKKMYEAQRDRTMNQAFNIEQAKFAQDAIKDSVHVVEAMKVGAKEMKKQYKKIDINKVEDLHDDMADLLADANEIQEVMGRSYGLPDEIDESELDDELAALEDELSLEPAAAAPSYLAPARTESSGEAQKLDEFGLPDVPGRAEAAPQLRS